MAKYGTNSRLFGEKKYYLQGLYYYDKKNYKQALVKFNECLKSSPKNPTYLQYKGHILVQLEEYLNARISYNKWFKLTGDPQAFAYKNEASRLYKLHYKPKLLEYLRENGVDSFDLGDEPDSDIDNTYVEGWFLEPNSIKIEACVPELNSIKIDIKNLDGGDNTNVTAARTITQSSSNEESSSADSSDGSISFRSVELTGVEYVEE